MRNVYVPALLVPVDTSVPVGLRPKNPGRPLADHVGEPLPAVNV
jgi:hypothetical protein